MQPFDLERYREQGYLLVRGLFPEESLRRFDERFVALVEGEVKVPDDMVVMRDVMVVRGAVEPETPAHAINKIMSFESDPVLFDYALHPPLLAAVREIVGPEVMTISTNVFNKPPGIDGRHPFHQDLRYFAIRPADAIVASWTAIGPATRESGCLAVIPGSHREELHGHADPDWEYVNFGFFAAEGVDREARVHVEMDPGDTLLFHPLLLHGSGHNRTQRFRRAISAHYASLACRRPDGGASKRDRVTRRIPSPGPS